MLVWLSQDALRWHGASRWRRGIETLSPCLTLREGVNRSPVIRRLIVSSVVTLNKLLNKQSSCLYVEMPRLLMCDVTVMTYVYCSWTVYPWGEWTRLFHPLKRLCGISSNVQSNLWYWSHQTPTLNHFLSRLAVRFALSIEARCQIENDDVVRAAPTGDAPTTSELSTILLPTRVRLILEVWLYSFRHFWTFTECNTGAVVTEDIRTKREKSFALNSSLGCQLV